MSRSRHDSHLAQLPTAFDVHHNPGEYACVKGCEAQLRCNVKGYVREQAAPRMERIWDVLVVGVLLVAAAFGFVWFLPQ